MASNDLLLFALGASQSYGTRVAERLGVPLAAHEEREFEDGQHKARSLVNVRGRDTFVLHSLHGDDEQSVNDKLCRLLFFLGSLRDASAATVTAVVPFLCYSRKDKKTKSRDPVTTRYVAAMFEAVQVDRVVTLDVHNLAAFQNAFRCRTEHLEARDLFASYIVVSGEAVVGDVAGRTAILIDDMISSGGTIVRAARACRAAGAGSVWATASHGVFTSGADEALADEAIDRVIILDTIPPDRLGQELVESKVHVLDASGLFSEAIAAMHSGGSLVELNESWGER